MSASPSPAAPLQTLARPKYPSDATRAERRRTQRSSSRLPEREAALNYAQQLQFLADQAPDEQTRQEINKTILGIRLRFSHNENERRFAVLRALEGAARLTLAEVVEVTRLPRDVVQSILDDFVSPDVELVEITTMSGKQRCGRRGTVLYYGLRH
jgi:hypothetical protein